MTLNIVFRATNELNTLNTALTSGVKYDIGLATGKLMKNMLNNEVGSFEKIFSASTTA